MPEIGTSGSMSGDGKRAIGNSLKPAPILDSTPPHPGYYTSSHSRRTAAFAFNCPGVPSNTMAPCPMT
jgi:hypothetical protein